MGELSLVIPCCLGKGCTHMAYVTKLCGLSREGTIPTELPPLVGEVSVNFCGERVSRG
jgi:hypothetical protein